MTIHCIIVEDEPVSQDILLKYITDTPQLNLVGVCNNAFDARDMLLKKPVDLMFLDINMPRLSGMSFLKSLEHPPLAIFTTAYPEYAIESYEVSAVDYLLKPFSFERFIKAVNKAVEILAEKDMTSSPDRFIMLKADKKTFKVPLKEITHLEAMGDYVKVYYNNTFILVHDTLQNLYKLMPEKSFVQIHRSYIISHSHLQYIDGNQIKIAQHELPVGKNYREAVRRIVKEAGEN
ncbi:MAG: LytTR family DNA-binding domain-containing protein [Bacteroidales bacterium]|nr:LytTR family DNA-binding domain-containing protein [Bacteroidales bacterium]MCF8402985.1 LytTR family DNA-binding domain-containing protein [Bacteroidales bacterium]